MSLININNLTFSYDGSFDEIFENVSFQIDTNWKLGFIGRNGRGKTTFLNLLLGKYSYKGSITSSVSFDYFPFNINDKSQNTIDIIYGINCSFEYWQLLREMNLLQVNEDVLYRPFNTLSHGEQTKVMLAVLFLHDNNFLLIDEPTNHLDITAREIVSRYLNDKKGFILVSHDRTFIDGCVDHVLSINKNNIQVQKGNFSSWQYNKKMEDDQELEKNQKLTKDIKRLNAAAKRTEKWSDKVEKSKKQPLKSGLSGDAGYIGHKSAKMMKRSKTLEKRQQYAIEEKSSLLKNIENADDLKINPLIYHSNRLLSLDNVSIYYEDKQACKDVSFEIMQGDKIALCGKNGSGKSSVLKLIIGESIKYRGNFVRGSNLKISYVSQDTSNLTGTLSDFANQNSIDESLFKTILRKLDFTRDQLEKDIQNFSAGQKKKVAIAKSLCEQAHLYVWDEPLNYIDVLSRIQIEQLIERYSPTMIFVEHDKAFCDKIASKTVQL